MNAWLPGAWAWEDSSADGYLVVEPSGHYCVTMVDHEGVMGTSFGTWEADDADRGTWRAEPQFVSPPGHPFLGQRCQQFAFEGPDVLLMTVPGQADGTVRWVRLPARCEP